MLERIKLRELNDFFLELNARKEAGVYFCRINGYNEAIHNFIGKYYEAARSSGVVIEGRIPNPDERIPPIANPLPSSLTLKQHGKALSLGSPTPHPPPSFLLVFPLHTSLLLLPSLLLSFRSEERRVGKEC